jgi:hypothetical protein
MRKSPRPAAKSAKARAAVRPAARSRKLKPAELTVEEVTNLETLSSRYEESERAWQRMNSVPDGDETWNQVEEHLLNRGSADPERRWKYFSK